MPVVTAFLDGEVVVETERGTPDFGALQEDLSEGRSDRFRYYLFDLLHLDGIDLTRASLLDRKAALARLVAGHDDGVLKLQRALQPSAATSCSGMPAVWASKASSPSSRTAPYRSGRTKAWLKSKCIDSDEFVIIGYVPSTTQRRAIGSLVLGYFDKSKLVYAGRVGSGFSTAAAEDLWRRLEVDPRRRARSRCAAARRRAPQRALDQAVAGGRGRDARLDRRRHPAPRRVQGPAPGQAGGRCRPGEARREAKARNHASPFRSPIPTACCGPTPA